jgi:hypothetical protein
MRVISTIAVLIGAAACAAGAEPRPPVVLWGEKVAVEALEEGGGLRERYLALRDGGWIEIATGSEGATSGPVSLTAAGGKPIAGSLRGISLSEGELVEEIAVEGGRIVRRIAIYGGPWIRVATWFEPSAPMSLLAFSDRLRFSHRPDWSFSPSVGGFNPDAQYKAPLILVQAGRAALGIVPDVAALGRDELKRCPHALDLDAPGGPILSAGRMPARRMSHSVYSPAADRSWTAGAAVENRYFVLLDGAAEPGEAYRRAVRFHWERFGRAEQMGAAGQQAGTDPAYRGLALWDDWRNKVWEEETRRDWLAVALPGGSKGGAVRTKRWGPGPSVYLSSWFNSLRTAFGTALHARRTGSADLLALARGTVEIALRAPGRDGAFKCVAVPVKDGAETVWAAGDGSGGSTESGYLGYDMSWTGYWLLRWRAAGLPGGEEILPRCRKLAEFLAASQAPDGMLPTRFAEDGRVSEETSRTVMAETGPVVLFLLELFAQDPDPRLLAAARKGLEFLEREVIPERRWYDYETFWSCSPRKPRFDERTRQWPANDLALGQTVAAYLAAHRITGEARYLEQGERLLDYLLLYQQCWTNPVLEGLSGPAMLLGGFTTQNSDAEWSDARQSQFGNVLLDYYRAIGKVEYLERGVAALRAQFPVSPSENWAHEGYGGKAGVSSFHWGSGSGLAGIEIEEDFLRDAVVDVAAARGVGVNGIDVTRCAVEGDRIRLEMSSPFPWKRKPVVVFHRTEPSKTYRLNVNGVDAGSRRGEDLEKGVEVGSLP